MAGEVKWLRWRVEKLEAQMKMLTKYLDNPPIDLLGKKVRFEVPGVLPTEGPTQSVGEVVDIKHQHDTWFGIVEIGDETKQIHADLLELVKDDSE